MSTLIPATFSNLTGSGLAVPGSSGSGLSSLPRAVAKPVQRELDWLSGRAELAQARDMARAELTSQAMHHVGTLVMTGQAVAQLAPESAPYLEALLGAYATGAAQAVARFQ